jgi:hypothetical protein
MDFEAKGFICEEGHVLWLVNALCPGFCPLKLGKVKGIFMGSSLQVI